ncbi:dynamin family protein [Acrocarpospora sp. B8E8]|uniref:dynamin family protein n=1 Tax=Acrocarpospora sp. B8E8 TaxID=3153572 RepID=UPI00325DF4C8
MLRDRAMTAFDTAQAALAHSPALAQVSRALAEYRERFGSALRVALVGRVSSGKSTLANALLGGRRAPTGVEELTFNVNWLRYGTSPGLLVHFTDGRPPERRDLADLERLTVRAHEDEALAAYLRTIDYLEVTDPNPYLRSFDLVDTPGLDTAFGSDSQNTARFLGRTPGDVRAASLDHAGKADAIVLVFARGLAAAEEELLADFTGAGIGKATPITTLGALTKVELFWPLHPDPMAEGARVADRLMNAAGARRYLFDLRPVASLVGAAAAVFTQEDFDDLTTLAAVPPETLTARVKRGPLFTTRDHPELKVSAARRHALFSQFGGYGIVLACSLIRDGVTDIAELRWHLLERSGMADFRRLLVDHFGSRTELIKLSRAIQDVKQLPSLAGELGPRDHMTLDEAVAAVAQLEFKEHAFAEFSVLRDYYDGRVDFADEEIGELLLVTGECGRTLPDRLGLPSSYGRTELAAQARERLAHWAAVVVDPSYSGATRRAGQVVRRSYELLISEINGAQP